MAGRHGSPRSTPPFRIAPPAPRLRARDAAYASRYCHAGRSSSHDWEEMRGLSRLRPAIGGCTCRGCTCAALEGVGWEAEGKVGSPVRRRTHRGGLTCWLAGRLVAIHSRGATPSVEVAPPHGSRRHAGREEAMVGTAGEMGGRDRGRSAASPRRLFLRPFPSLLSFPGRLLVDAPVGPRRRSQGRWEGGESGRGGGRAGRGGEAMEVREGGRSDRRWAGRGHRRE